MSERKPLNELELAEIHRIAEAARDGTHFDSLGIDLAATREELESAYHNYVRHWHPDRFFTRETSAAQALIDENFAAVTRAFRVLRDPTQRIAYEMELRAQNRSPKTLKPAPAVKETGIETPGFEVSFQRPGKAPPVSEVRAPQPQPVRARAPSAVEKIKQQLAAQLVQAKRYFDAGKADFDAGNWSKSESNLYLATRYDPQNPEYQAMHRDAVARARQVRAQVLLAQAEQAESYGQSKEAIAYYKRCIELDPPDGKAYFRLAQILRTQEDDMRGAVDLYRKAVAKSPKALEYHLVLAEVYDSINLKENARRVFAAAQGIDRNHAQVKALEKKLR